MIESSNLFFLSVVSDNRKNISHSADICYFGLKGLTPKEIYEDMVFTLGENAPSYGIVKKRDAEFKCGTDSLRDNPCRRRPVTVTTQETIAKIHDILWQTDE